MPVTPNPNECGWFYHAPAKNDPTKPKMDYPAPSNIPGIGFDEPVGKEEVKEMMFRETDSEYTRLAKMGGRKDLLVFTPDRNKKNAQGPAGYPRNDWFYLEDNRVEDEEKRSTEKKQWQFLLPDYMVHKSYMPSFEEPGKRPVRSAAPYFTEATSMTQEEGRMASDKTVKIAERRQPGYGVRNQRPSPKTHQVKQAEKPQDLLSPIGGDARRFRPHIAMPSERDDPTSISKLLAGDYERQWYAKLAEVQQKQPEGEPALQEYHNTHADIGDSPISGQNRNQVLDPYNSHRRRVQEDADRELFKLSRFKNVPSKLDSHQRPEILAAAK